jgi:diguanylate cyclase (GGDEF)-like protein/PAS domain S-box-containing protein
MEPPSDAAPRVLRAQTSAALWTQDLGNGGPDEPDDAVHERVSAILESISDGFFALQREWRFSYVNREAERLLDRPRAEILGRTFFEIFPDATGTVFYEAYAAAMRGEGPIDFEAESSARPDTWFEVRAYPAPEGISVFFRDITERRRVEAALRENEERYRLMVEGSEQVFFFLHGLDHRFEYLSPSVQSVLGYAPEELIAQPYEITLADPAGEQEVNEFTDSALSTGTRNAPYLGRLRRKDGRIITVELVEGPVVRDGKVVGMQGFARDITERRRAEEELRKSEERYRSLFEESRDAIYITTREGALLDVNESTLELLGYTRDEIIGMNVRELYVDMRDRARFQEQIEGTGSVRDFELQLRTSDGRVLDCLLSSTVRRDDQGGVAGYQGIIHDITDRKRVQERLLHDALHDSLTGLPNRTLLMDRLSFALERTRRRGEHFAVLFMDVDRFKMVNDSLGHLRGDELLVGLAARLSSCLRPGDTIARLGGDEFTILLADMSAPEDAERVADRIHEAMTPPFQLAGQEVFASVSIGIARSSADYNGPEELLRDADLAMYRAKSVGRGQHRVFDATMHQAAVETLQMETDLRRAVERQEFEIHYQPLVALADHEVVGFEALLRWRHPERGLLLPGSFIPIAEESGLIVGIGRWVLMEACAQLQRWRAGHACARELSVSVNLSARQFARPDLVDQIEEVLADSGLPGGLLHLEITETVVMEDAPAAIELLGRLKDRGVQLCIDDFGIGYSSLGYLRRFPIDRLKIDHSFVRGIVDNRDSLEIVQTILELARSLELDAVPEGVETAEQESQLRALDCRFAQGFHFARPLPAARVEELLERGLRLGPRPFVR